MSDEIIIRQCAPTLAGIKTGSLFCCPYENKQDTIREVSVFNRQHLQEGLCLLPLRYRDNRVLLLLFRPEQLTEDLQRPVSLSILEDCGYACKTYGEYLAMLIKRLSESNQFPHEIGLFIGYPPEDVQGFIENKAKNYKCSGLWKVYGDEEHAQGLFRRFKECTELYRSKYQSGYGLENLIITGRKGNVYCNCRRK